MGSLTRNQIEQISADLQAQGITFEPLRQELLDHLICDIESQMDDGRAFNDAWIAVRNNIPQNHFKKIQTETMELLNKKINPLRIFAIISLSLLIFATLFKIMHLQGAAVLLLAFLITTSLTLLVGSARSVYVYRESKGRGVIFLATILIITFIVALCFKVLHLPGATELMYFSIIALCILLPSLSIYFYVSKQQLKDYLLIRLISDNQNLLEKTALVLIGFGLLFNYSSLLFGPETFGGVIFFIFSVILIGMYVYSLTWKYYVDTTSTEGPQRFLLLLFSSLAFVSFMMPVLGAGINEVLRNYLAYIPLIIFIGIVSVFYGKFSGSKNRSTLSALSLLLLFYPILRLGTKLQWYGDAVGSLTTNPIFILGFLIFLLVLLAIYRKEKLFKALVILTIASHMIPNI
jgi:hypothetical protein